LGARVIVSLPGFGKLGCSAFWHIGRARRERIETPATTVKTYDGQRIVILNSGEEVKLLALVRDVALDGAKPKISTHVVVGLRGSRTPGGPLPEAHVRPTLEIIVTESPAYLKREHEAESDLALIRIGV